MEFARLKKNLSKDFSAFKKISVVLLGDSATQLLAVALRGYGYEIGLNLEVHDADYGQIDLQILDPHSHLYASSPKYVIIYHSSQHLRRRFYSSSVEEKRRFAETHLSSVRRLSQTIHEVLPATSIIYLNFCEIDDAVFGNYANKVDTSFLWQLRKINAGLMDCARSVQYLHICDLLSLQMRQGMDFLFDSRLYVNADMVIGLNALPALTERIAAVIRAIEGSSKKCLILDLDNTLWGGVIGDAGMGGIEIGDLGIGKAFTELQLWIKQLQERGIILAVCSKNDEAVAKEPFESHPDMILRTSDIAVFVANWDNKVENLRKIQRTLNIGFDSMVFIDDNPAERDLVRRYIPDLTVPELPEDPSEFLPYLQHLNLFETVSLTEEDAERTKQYQDQANRDAHLNTFVNEDEFLSSLDMTSCVEPFRDRLIPRAAQLTQRSNQFNLRTIRYTENELKRLASSKDYLTFTFTLTDKFGDNGLISLIVLRRQNTALFIDTWLMSCRVLKRGMENFVLNELVAAGRKEGARELVGEYLPSSKNQLVKDHYSQLGFRRVGEQWTLDLSTYINKPTHIKKQLKSSLSARESIA